MARPLAPRETNASDLPVEALAANVRLHLGEEASLVGARVVSAGMSDDTWMVDVEREGEPIELVVRRHKSGGVLREQTDTERHFEVLAALDRERIPAPEPLWFEPDPAVLGGPFFAMRRIEGTVVVPWSKQGREFLERAGRGPLGEDFIATLAAIHDSRWRDTALERVLGDGGVDAGANDAATRLAAMRSAVESYRLEPEPVLADALCWLERNLPEQTRVALVHGDYRTGNVVFGTERIAGVLDWEFARLGDPASDLAWLLGRTNRLGSDLAAYILPRERVLELYERFAGWVPSEAALHFWEVLNLVFNTSLWMSGGFNYARGLTRDLALARWSYTLPKLRRLVLDALEEG